MAFTRRHTRALLAAACVPALLVAGPAAAAPQGGGGAPQQARAGQVEGAGPQADQGRPSNAERSSPAKREEPRQGRAQHTDGGQARVTTFDAGQGGDPQAAGRQGRGRTERPDRRGPSGPDRTTASVDSPTGAGGAENPQRSGGADGGRTGGRPSAAPPAAGPTAHPVPGPDPVRPNRPGQEPAGPVLVVPDPGPAPGSEPATATAPPIAVAPAVPRPGFAPTPAAATTAADATAPRPERPVVGIRAGWPLTLHGQLGTLLEDVGTTIDRVVPGDLGPMREPLARVVPLLLAVLGAFLALQRGIGRGLGHVPMVAVPPRLHTLTHD